MLPAVVIETDALNCVGIESLPMGPLSVAVGCTTDRHQAVVAAPARVQVVVRFPPLAVGVRNAFPLRIVRWRWLSRDRDVMGLALEEQFKDERHGRPRACRSLGVLRPRGTICSRPASRLSGRRNRRYRRRGGEGRNSPGLDFADVHRAEGGIGAWPN